jgi:hypothetical protein
VLILATAADARCRYRSQCAAPAPRLSSMAFPYSALIVPATTSALRVLFDPLARFDRPPKLSRTSALRPSSDSLMARHRPKSRGAGASSSPALFFA